MFILHFIITTKSMNILIFVYTMISIISLNWTVFTSDEGAFSVLTPGEMQYEVKQIPTSTGEISLHNYTYRATDTIEHVFLYSITHYALPLDELDPDSTDINVQDLFDETLSSIASRIRGEILYSQEETLENFPARISRIKYNEGQYSLKNKIVLANDQIYLIEVFSTYDKGAEFKIRKFINSFNILDPTLDAVEE